MDKKQRRHKPSKGSSSSGKSSSKHKRASTSAEQHSSDSYVLAHQPPIYQGDSYSRAGSDMLYPISESIGSASGPLDLSTTFTSGAMGGSNLLVPTGLSPVYNQGIYNLPDGSSTFPASGYMPAGNILTGGGTSRETSHEIIGQSSGPNYQGSFGSWGQMPVQQSPAANASFGEAPSSWAQANLATYGPALGSVPSLASVSSPYYGSESPPYSSMPQEGSFHCEVEGCGKIFTRSYNYKAHLETHDEQREYPFHCGEGDCDKKFARKTDLQRHHQSVHMKERNHGCAFCGRFFARKDTLRRHMEDGCSKRFDIETIDLERA